ncbi:MAG: hypothetical protein ACMXYL_01055 [Candidatus Woesearchaeota archaeon]
MDDYKFALWSKYTLMAMIMFMVLFSLRGSCDAETRDCAGGFPYKWLFRDAGGVFVSWNSIMLNIVSYYLLSGLLLYAMRIYAKRKNRRK